MNALYSCTLSRSLVLPNSSIGKVNRFSSTHRNKIQFQKMAMFGTAGEMNTSLNMKSVQISCSADLNGNDNKNEISKSLVNEFQGKNNLLTSSTAFFLLQSAVMCTPAFASGYTDQEYVEGILTLVAFAGFYLFVAPPLIYWYFKERTFKSKMWETIFQFCVMFLFFPGLLLWAPFINFRPLPTDPSKMPKF